MYESIMYVYMYPYMVSKAVMHFYKKVLGSL